MPYPRMTFSWSDDLKALHEIGQRLLALNISEKEMQIHFSQNLQQNLNWRKYFTDNMSI